MTHSGSRVTKRLLFSLVVALLACTLTLASGAAAADDSGIRAGNNLTVEEAVIENDRADPPTDRLGWEHGVWANATLSINQSDGIDQRELEAIVARTMARVETVREIEFQRTPPVRVISQQRQREETGRTAYNETQRTLLNAQYESLFLINESRDAVDSRRVLLGSGVSGYYRPETRNVTMVSPDDSVPQIQESVLAQELYHAQQDNRFDLPAVETIEERNTRNGYVEGDANYVQQLYEQHCRDAWSGTCYLPERSTAPDLSGLNEGMIRLFQQPYQSGYAFVRERHQRQGWDAVNKLYERPPASTEQIIHPETYREDEPAALTVTDRSSGDWRPLRADGRRVTGSVGEAGLYVSMVYPALQTNGQRDVIPQRNHLVGGFGETVQLGYDHPITTGWDGDRLLPYVASDGNETGYVYEIAWDSRSDAREFHQAYRKLLAYHNADPVDGLANTYRVPASDGFTDAFYVERDGDSLRIVNAPTVEALTSISKDAAPPVNSSGMPVPWQRVERTSQTELSGRGSPSSTVADGRIYFTGLDGSVRAVNATTGDLVWVQQVNETVTNPPAVSNGSVYVVTTRSTVVALEATRGDIQWRRDVTGSLLAEPTVANGTVYLGTSDNTVAALDAATGEPRWKQSTPSPVGTTLAITDTHVYATSRSGLSAFDRSTGKVVWNVTVNGTILTAPTVTDETVYMTDLNIRSGDSRIHAVGAATGDDRWTRRVNGTVPSVLKVTEDAVYSGGSGLRTASGSLSAFDRDRGDRMWRLELNGSVNTDPVISDGTVYVGSNAGRLYAVDAGSGDRQFTMDVDGAVTSPILTSNDTLYIGTDGGVLYALNRSTGDRQWLFVADGLAATRPVVSAERAYAQAGSTLYGLEASVTADGSGDDTRNTGSQPGQSDPGDEATETPPTPDDDPGADTSQSTDTDDETTTTSGDGPGFALVAIAGGILFGAVLLALKRRGWGPEN